MGGNTIIARLEAGENVRPHNAFNALEQSSAYTATEFDHRLLVYRHEQEDAAAIIDLKTPQAIYETGDIDETVQQLADTYREEEPCYLGTRVTDGTGAIHHIPDDPDPIEIGEGRFKTRTEYAVDPADISRVRTRIRNHAKIYEQARGPVSRYQSSEDEGVRIVVEPGTVTVIEEAVATGLSTLPPSLLTGLSLHTYTITDNQTGESYRFEWEEPPKTLHEAFEAFTAPGGPAPIWHDWTDPPHALFARSD